MGIGVIELAVIVAVVALIARGIGAGHLLFWAMTIVGVLAVLFLARAVTGTYLLPGPPPEVQLAYQHDGWTHAPQGQMMPTTPPARLSMFGLLLLFALPAVMFAIARRLRHHGPHGMLPLAGAATIALLFAGIYFVRSSSHRHDYHTPPVPMPLESHAVIAQVLEGEAAVPVDELWERMMAPQIAIDGQSSTTEGPTAQKLAAQREAVQGAIQFAKLVQEKLEAMAASVTTAAADASHVTAEAEEEVSTTVTAEAVSQSPVSEVDQPPTLDPMLISRTSSVRPGWVDQPPKLDGPVQRLVVEAGPYSTLTECHEKLRQEIARTVKERLQELANDWMGRVTYVPELTAMQLGNAALMRELLLDQYVETTQASIGEMKTAWAMLEFDQADDQRLLEAWQGYARRDGIAVTAVGSLIVLGALGLVYGLISIDTWTRGYYTKRLFIGVPAAIIAFVMLIAAVA